VKEFNVITTRFKNILAQEQGRRKAHHADSEDEIDESENEEVDDNNDTPAEGE
jgi:hypothetical protein